MKIVRIAIENWGQFQNYEQSFSLGLNVMYGENETGKSTIRAFVLATLFGLSADDRKKHDHFPEATLGGCVYVCTEENEEYAVRRTFSDRERKQEDFSVTDEFGSILPPTHPFVTMLSRYDKKLVESLFFFSVGELAHISGKSKHSFTDLLLFLSADGRDGLLQEQHRMDEQMQLLYKKKGKRPEINHLLLELKELKQQLREKTRLEQQNREQFEVLEHSEQQYATLAKEERALEQRILTLQPYTMYNREIEQYLALRKSTDSEQELSTALQTYDRDIVVGEWQALLRNEQRLLVLSQQLEERTAQQQSLQSQWSEEDQTNLVAFIERAEKLKQIEEAFVYELTEVQAFALESTQFIPFDKWEHYTQLLEIEIPYEKFISAFQAFEQLEKERYQLDDAYTQDNELLLQKEHEMQHLAGTILSETDRHLCESARIAHAEKQQADLSIREKEDELQNALKNARNGEEKHKNTMKLFIVIASLLAILSVVAVVYNETIIGGLIGAFAVTFTALSVWTHKQRLKIQELLAIQMEAIQELLNKQANLSKNISMGLSEAERRLAQDKAATLEMEVLKKISNDIQFKLDRILNGNEEWAVKKQSWNSEWGILKASLPERLQIDSIEKQIALLNEWKNVQGLIRKWEKNATLQKEWNESVTQFLQDLSVATKTPFQPKPLTACLEQFQGTLSHYENHMSDLFVLKNEISAVEKEMYDREVECEHLRSTHQHMFQVCGVENYDAFFANFDALNEKKNTRQQLADFLIQHGEVERLYEKLSGESNDEKRQSFENMLEQYVTCGEQYKVVSKDLSDVGMELTKLKTGLEVVYRSSEKWEIEQQIRMLSEQLKEKVLHYAELKLYSDSVKYAISQFESNQLPLFLMKCSEIFSYITNHRYIEVFYTKKDGFSVRQTEGRVFSVEVLSQGTKEQLAVSIRLSLALGMTSSYPFPLWFDDAFVHYDNERRQQMFGLLQSMAPKTQFVYFSCDDNILSLVPNEQQIVLTT
ncbi:MAG: AAA family ATPase [Bacilli bacterium]